MAEHSIITDKIDQAPTHPGRSFKSSRHQKAVSQLEFRHYQAVAGVSVRAANEGHQAGKEHSITSTSTSHIVGLHEAGCARCVCDMPKPPLPLA